MNALIAAAFFQIVLSAPVQIDTRITVTYVDIYPAALTADCSDQSNGWDPYTFPYAPLEIDAADTQQGDGCLDASAPWPTESLP